MSALVPSATSTPASTTLAAVALGNPSAPPRRDDAIDRLRGLVMALMVLDHARDFWFGIRVRPLDLAATTPALFATRWITHFCAPVFVLLAGVAAYLYGQKHGDAARSRFLLSRGLFLVLLEVTLIRLLWVPDPLYHFTLLQVIWVLGWSMVALAALSRAPRRVIAAVGGVLVLGHNALDDIHANAFGPLAPLWNLLHERATLTLAPGHVVYVSYPLVPWVGVMALGYALGPLLARSAATRQRPLLILGGGLTLGFLLLRAFAHYGNPVPWSSQHSTLLTVLSFLNCEKYPPSLDYLLMTLGPALMLLALAPAPGSRWSFLTVFGRAPLVFYVLHLFVLRYTSIPVAIMRLGAAALERAPRGPSGSPELPLWVTYAIWLATLLALYPACRWYARVKASRPRAWMSYV